MCVTSYKEPGRYVAICRGVRGVRAKVFDFPAQGEPDAEGRREQYEGQVNAAWYYLNRLDLESELLGLYPASAFAGLQFPEA